jgi:hypothetical protein
MEAASSDLRKASDQAISGILQSNAYLRPNGAYQRKRLGNRDALLRRLSGTSGVTNKKEVVDVYTTLAGENQLFYVVQVVPEGDLRRYRRAFDEMIRSVTFVN